VSTQPTRISESERAAAEAVGFDGTLSAVVASNYKPIGKNTLIASVDLTIPRWHLTFRGCLFHRKNGREWAAFPAREWIDQPGAKQYADLIKFTDRATAERFQAAALAAIHAVAGEAGS
jgi:hypothetical protein